MLSEAPDAREDAIDDGQLGAPRRHERSRLRDEREQRDLAQIRALAPHVGPGQNHELAVGRVEQHVVRDERVGDVPLDDRMPRLGRLHLVALVHVRLDVVVDRGRFGQPGQHVERRDGARRVQNARRLAGHARAERLEQLELARQNPLVGAEHLIFVVLERGRDEALAAGNRLLARVVGRHRAEVRFRHLDVVPEHAVVPDLERRDARARPLGFFHGGDRGAAAAADVAQPVELGIDAVANDAAIAHEGRRLAQDRAFDRVTDVDELVDLRRQALEERRLKTPPCWPAGEAEAPATGRARRDRAGPPCRARSARSAARRRACP